MVQYWGNSTFRYFHCKYCGAYMGFEHKYQWWKELLHTWEFWAIVVIATVLAFSMWL
jgi:hypothetical protein